MRRRKQGIGLEESIKGFFQFAHKELLSLVGRWRNGKRIGLKNRGSRDFVGSIPTRPIEYVPFVPLLLLVVSLLSSRLTDSSRYP